LDGIQLIRGELELSTYGLTVSVSKDLKEKWIMLCISDVIGLKSIILKSEITAKRWEDTIR
jgi:hypothetical protein